MKVQARVLRRRIQSDPVETVFFTGPDPFSPFKRIISEGSSQSVTESDSFGSGRNQFRNFSEPDPFSPFKRIISEGSSQSVRDTNSVGSGSGWSSICLDPDSDPKKTVSTGSD